MDLGSKVVKTLFKQKSETDFSGREVLYTDGSKTERQDYAGLIIFSPQLDLVGQFKVDKAAPVFTTEALAIKICLEYIKANNI